MNLLLAAQALEEGRSITIKPRGNSMYPRIKSGQEVRLEPATTARRGEAVLARVRGALYLHEVSAIQDGRHQISNKRGHVNGWASRIYGVATNV
jgi:phage repressor protein C with HTH and peptisase S24 domain